MPKQITTTTTTEEDKFSIANRATWPEVLKLDQVAAIYQRGVHGVRKQLELGTFIPAPRRRKPYRWSKADLIRDIDGSRGLRKAG